MLMDMFLCKFDIHESKGAPNCFKSHANSRCPDFFFFFFLPEVRSEIHLVRRNIVFTEQSARS